MLWDSEGDVSLALALSNCLDNLQKEDPQRGAHVPGIAEYGKSDVQPRADAKMQQAVLASLHEYQHRVDDMGFSDLGVESSSGHTLQQQQLLLEMSRKAKEDDDIKKALEASRRRDSQEDRELQKALALSLQIQ